VDHHEILRFLEAIDAELLKHAGKGETLDVHLLGRSALILGFGLTLMTKDIDIVYVHGSRLQQLAVETFGKDTLRASQHGFYLEAVSSGLPPLPAGYQARCIALLGTWRVIRPMRPEANDLAVTKLRRFHAKDREDVRILCDTGLLSSDTLRERLDAAHYFTEEEDEGRRASYANLEVVIEYLKGRRRTL
jgi:hypothetical protein